MGTYYDADKIKANGKSVWRIEGKQPTVPQGQRLLAIVNNGLRNVCPDVTDPDEYQNFYDAYYQGYWIEMNLYLIPEASLADCIYAPAPAPVVDGGDTDEGKE